MNTTTPHNLSSEVISRGNWINLEHITYVNKLGNQKIWECASRVNGQGAAMMITTLRPSDRIVILRQFRPTVNKMVIEFPAGLIDPDEDPADTAVRELYEETGYHGEVTEVLPPTCNSPGLTGERVTTVMLEVDETRYEQTPPVPAHEEDEHIEVFAVHASELEEFLIEADRNGDIIDSKVITFAVALKHK